MNFDEKYENTNYSTVNALVLAIFQIFYFNGSSVIYLSLSEIPIWMESPESIRVKERPQHAEQLFASFFPESSDGGSLGGPQPTRDHHHGWQPQLWRLGRGHYDRCIYIENLPFDFKVSKKC